MTRRSQPRVAQAIQALRHLGVRRQFAHCAQDPLLVLVGEAYSFALGDHLQRGVARRADVRIRPGYRGDEGGRQELQKPGPPHPGFAEGPLEVGVERPEDPAASR